ncbi:hypothetical protein CDAR_251251 [Caerostris darwini]|uniref:Ribosomal protein L32 n=1 Tax=Caerostris darwini TaxID=1538125 RepID=A0AAV4R9K2_9ARAC|nr:hypothetical protein CDAR_251251 [Caerostris darwini]
MAKTLPTDYRIKKQKKLKFRRTYVGRLALAPAARRRRSLTPTPKIGNVMPRSSGCVALRLLHAEMVHLCQLKVQDLKITRRTVTDILNLRLSLQTYLNFRPIIYNAV